MKTALVVMGLWAVLCIGFLFLWYRLMQFVDPNNEE